MMADSTGTKQAFAQAMKLLMQQKPFQKISIGDICAACQKNRKSFYYHFQDKYDLVHWIFESEFLWNIRKDPDRTPGHFLQSLCLYLEENHVFYERALSIQGQNSFSGDLRSCLQPVAMDYLRASCLDGKSRFLYADFLIDGWMSTIGRWMEQKKRECPESMAALLSSFAEAMADGLNRPREMSTRTLAVPVNRARKPMQTRLSDRT